MSKWISVKDRFPKEQQKVLVKTDCDNCPVMSGVYAYNLFHISLLCDDHLEADRDKDEKFFEAAADYCRRITYWIPLP